MAPIEIGDCISPSIYVIQTESKMDYITRAQPFISGVVKVSRFKIVRMFSVC